MASSPITSWQIDRETVETGWLNFLGSKITADGDCSHEIKRHFEFPTLNPPPTTLPISSLWVIPVHQPQASCIEPRLAIHFLQDSIQVSMPFSQIIPPSPSPSESKSPFYTSVSLLLSCIQVHHYHLSKFHIYVSVYCIGVFLSGLLHSVWSAPVSSTSLELIQMYSF